MAGRQQVSDVRPVPVGRDRELDVGVRAAAAAGRGMGSVLLIAGEAGVGKTWLAEEIAVRHDGAVAWSTCSEGEGVPGFWPWVQLLRRCTDAGLVPAVAGAEPGLRLLLDGRSAGDAAGATRFRLFEGVAAVLAATAAATPLVVVLDDLQWADEASIRLLQFVARDVRRLPLLIVCTYRDTDVGCQHPLTDALAELARAGQHLTLRGLPPADLLTLMRTSAAALRLDDDDATWLHRQTGGNPFFARELAQLIAAGGAAASGRGESEASIPGGVRAVVQRRLGLLPPATTDVLAWASLLGNEFDPHVLADAAASEAAACLHALDAAVDARVVSRTEDGCFRFAHDLVRQTLVVSTPLAERATRHQALGRSLARRAGVDPARVAAVAEQLVAGAAAGDVEEAVQWAVRAAQRATDVLAYEDAANWYERAITCRRSVAAGDDEEGELLLALGTARLEAGRLPAARDAFVAAAGLARARGDPEQLARGALGLGAGLAGFEVSLFDHVQIDLLDDALEALPGSDSPLRAWVMARLSVALSFVDGSDRRGRLAEEAVGMSRRLDDRLALAYALAAWCDAFSGPDDVDARLSAAEEIVALAVGAADRAVELLGRRLRIVALMERGRLGEAAAEVDSYARTADVLRQPLYHWYVPLWRATLAMAEQRFEDAARATDEAGRIGALAHSENARTLVAVQRFARLRYEGRFAQAADVMRELLADTPDIAAPESVQGTLLVLDVAAADWERAVSRADRLTATGLHAPKSDSEWLANLAQLADVAHALQHPKLAAAVREALKPHAELFTVEGIGAAVYGAAAHHVAVCSRVIGDDATAAEYAALARELHDRAGLAAEPPSLIAGATAPRADTDAGDVTAALRHEGEAWSITYRGTTVRLRDSKGLRDLAVLLRSPGTAVHVTELTGAPVASTAADLDPTAVHAYRRRLVDLEEELGEAERTNDTGRAAILREEHDFLVDELTRSLGLGGRPRRSGDPVERARKAVTARVRDSIARIARAHPLLGRHLTNAVRTGTWCCYQPEEPLVWRT